MVAERSKKYPNTNPLGGKTTYKYDAAGNMIKTVDPFGNETKYKYNSMKKLIEVIDAKGNIYKLEYDENGNPTIYIDPEGNQTHMDYDYYNRLIKKRPARGQYDINEYKYDEIGRLVEHIGPIQELLERCKFEKLKKKYTYEKGNLTLDQEIKIEYLYDKYDRQIGEVK